MNFATKLFFLNFFKSSNKVPFIDRLAREQPLVVIIPLLSKTLITSFSVDFMYLESCENRKEMLISQKLIHKVSGAFVKLLQNAFAQFNTRCNCIANSILKTSQLFWYTLHLTLSAGMVDWKTADLAVKKLCAHPTPL